VFDGFLSLYGPGRPDWVLESELDLRPRMTRPGSGWPSPAFPMPPAGRSSRQRGRTCWAG